MFIQCNSSLLLLISKYLFADITCHLAGMPEAAYRRALRDMFMLGEDGVMRGTELVGSTPQTRPSDRGFQSRVCMWRSFGVVPPLGRMLGYGYIHDVSADIPRATGWNGYQEGSARSRHVTRGRATAEWPKGFGLVIGCKITMAWRMGCRSQKELAGGVCRVLTHI